MSEVKKIYDTTIYLKGGQTITMAFHKFSIDTKLGEKTLTWETVNGDEFLLTLDLDEIAAVTYKIRA